MAYRKRFLKCSKLRRPLPERRRFFTFLFIDSIGPLESLLSYRPPGPYYSIIINEFIIESLCFSRSDENSLNISYLDSL